MLEIKFSSKVGKALKRIPTGQRKRISTEIEALYFDSEPKGSRVVRGGWTSCRRIKVGNYRVIYLLEDDMLHIAVIDKRNDERAYR